MLEKIKTDYKDKLFSNIIHVNVKLKEAQNEGLNILAYDKYCRGAKDYFSLSREIITQENIGKNHSSSSGVERELEKEIKKKDYAFITLATALALIFFSAAPAKPYVAPVVATPPNTTTIPSINEGALNQRNSWVYLINNADVDINSGLPPDQIKFNFPSYSLCTISSLLLNPIEDILLI